jgi:hydroxypyruvate reductase
MGRNHDQADGPDMTDPTGLLLKMFEAAVAAAAPALCLPPHLPAPPRGRTVVVGAGKAAAAMARTVEAHWPAGAPLSGLVVTRHGHGVGALRRIEVVEASHPVPDEAGAQAAARMLQMVSGLAAEDLVLCLISGGASSLLGLPAPGIDLAAKQAINRQLLKSGATISEINTVRKHLSAIKGGRLALAAFPARIVTLIISDVPGDDPSVIGSGPTVPDRSTLAQARAVLARYGIAVPPAVAARLQELGAETPKPGDPAFARARAVLVAAPAASLAAAARIAQAAGVTPIMLGDRIEGEAVQVARGQAALALAQRGAAPCVLISGGETSVTVRGTGRGGRNAEYLLGLALALDGAPGIHAIACDTDGIDGTEDNAGALLGPDSLARARALGLDPAASLLNNDGYGFFAALGDLVVTGPTRTNVNDFRAVLLT